MDDFNGRIAVVTGGASGMGQELVVQLTAAGCHVATCDLSDASLADTLARCSEATDRGIRVTAHRCDVADATDMQRFAAEVREQHQTDCIHLLFNNAGVSGGQSFLRDDPEQWERIFGICWGGVYNGCRAFMPMLEAAPEARIVNTASVNGFWACLGPDTEHSAYSTAKFAVKGFSESLIVDLRLNAPHIGVSVVMPGHIGTGIALRSFAGALDESGGLSPEAADSLRRRWARIDPAAAQLSDAQVMELAQAAGEEFERSAPTTAAEASRIILQGVREGRWRILVGDDAVALDTAVRANPEAAYEADFHNGLASITI